MTDRDLNEFGMRLGLPGLGFSEEGTVSLSIGELGTLSLRRAEDDVLMSLSVPAPYFEAGRMRSLLEACAWQQGAPFAVSAGYFGERYVASVRCGGFSAAEAENALRRLVDLLHPRR
ncbi:MAG: CesT family type III secretion system chaperone [Mailhella sp.]|nr:CesT family type III secretion system chaperone [Mailhella sp.]